jgi:RHS repeat-associated protein
MSSKPGEDQKYLYLTDHLGSVRDLVDITSTPTLVGSFDYTPYGAVARSWGTVTPGYTYAGLFAHPNTGLLLSATRAYDPAKGKWLNKDPIRESGGINLYGYVGANPISWIDPEGLDKDQACVGTLRNCLAIIGGGVATIAVGAAEVPSFGTISIPAPAIIGGATLIGAAAGNGLGNLVCNEAADEEREKSKAKGIADKDIGPSGKPKIHVVEHPTKKKAKEAAAEGGAGAPIKHASPVIGGPHFHPTDGNGKKIPGIHHEYPE